MTYIFPCNCQSHVRVILHCGSYLREVVVTSLDTQRRKKIRGEKKIMEIDGSVFRKCRSNAGWAPSMQWVMVNCVAGESAGTLSALWRILRNSFKCIQMVSLDKRWSILRMWVFIILQSVHLQWQSCWHAHWKCRVGVGSRHMIWHEVLRYRVLPLKSLALLRLCGRISSAALIHFSAVLKAVKQYWLLETEILMFLILNFYLE